MEINITTKQILKTLQVLSWIIFIGLCIEAGGILFNTLYTFTIDPVNTKSFWERMDLSELYRFDHGHFLVIAGIMFVIAALKATMFYAIIKLLAGKNLSFSQPFSLALKQFIATIAYLSLGIGFFCLFGRKYIDWLTRQDVKLPDVQTLKMAGADVWLFMAVILFVITQIVKRGIEIQAENELTI